ncbi:GGDEF domain-containing protein [Myxosarcina sp. GI1]|uniref:GGDEF domain-containing protein n=1 Tax=Myxosarcina sp. GI1 TaxID=1541065 RepID=UPI00055CE757|nr:GGDEF domain-containing protein [Myxosarcina sp. GI1]
MKPKTANVKKTNYVLIISFIGVVIINVIDYLIVIDISLSILYLLPISFTSWYGKKRFSFSLVLLSTVGWIIGEYVAKPHLHPLIILWNTLVRLVVFFTIAYLISNLKTAYEKEKTLSRIDPLTGIANRRFFIELLRSESIRSVRYGHCLTLAYFDLDNFKEVNDCQGHDLGDKLLRFIAQTVKQQIRETDTVARLGGDEFALLLPETNYEAAQSILFRLQQQIRTSIEAYHPSVSLSIGAVTFQNFPDSTDKMLKIADRLMYRVKQSGKNNIEHELCVTPNGNIE